MRVPLRGRRGGGERPGGGGDGGVAAEGSGSSSDGDHVEAWNANGCHWHESMREGFIVSGDSDSSSERKGKWSFMIGDGRETLRHSYHHSHHSHARRAADGSEVIISGGIALEGDSGGRRFRSQSSHLAQQLSQMSLHKRCVFNAENSKALLYWDVLVSLTIFIVAMVAPYEALFMRPRLDMSFIRRRVLDAILVADMVLQFFVAFPDYKNRHGRMVTSQKVIVWHYLTGWFLVDIVGIFPVDCLLIWANTRSEYRDIVSAWFVFRALRLVRMLVLLRLMRIVDRYENKFGLSFAKLTLCKFFFITILACHWMACVWGSLAIHLSDGDTPTWLSGVRGDGGPLLAADLEGEEIFVYGMSVYWAIITLTSIGYGDITPQNGMEFLVATICCGVMASIWAYVIGSVCGIVSTLDPHEVSFKRTFDDLNWMMADVGMPSEMAQRFRKYFVEAKEMNKQRIENTVIDQMSPQLQGECAMFLHRKWVDKVWYLKSMSHEVVVWAARHLTVMVYAPNEEVLPERTLFIVRHGVCSSAGRILLGGDIWGQDMLISNEHLRNKHRVRALSYLHVLKLHITDLADIVLVFPDARLQLRRAQVKISFTRGFKMVSRAVQSLGEEGLPWWEIPPEWRPLLYAQILNGCYNAGDWLQRRWSNADTAEAEHGNARRLSDNAGTMNRLRSSSTKEVLDGLQSSLTRKPSVESRSPSKDILDQLQHSNHAERFKHHDATSGSGQDLDGPTVSMLCQQLMDLQRNVAVLAEKVDLLSQPAVQVHSSMMVTGDSAWGKHRNPSGASLEPGAGSTAALGRGRPQDWLRRLQPNDEAVDFGAFGAATERISDAVNAGVANIQGFSSSSKRMATNIASGISEKITASSGRLTSSFG